MKEYLYYLFVVLGLVSLGFFMFGILKSLGELFISGFLSDTTMSFVGVAFGGYLLSIIGGAIAKSYIETE